MSAVEAEKKVEDESKKVEKSGELLFCGGTSWDIVGRRKGAVEGNLVSPTRLRPLVGINIRFIASGCGNDLSHCFTWWCDWWLFLDNGYDDYVDLAV